MSEREFSIGIDLGGTNIAAGVVDRSGAILAKTSLPTYPQRDYADIVADMASAAVTACSMAGISLDRIAGIGIGSPGTVDSRNGTVIYANNLHFDNVPMCSEMRRHIDLPSYVGNDANCAALGETADCGAARGLRNVVLITLGTGLGGGILVDGRIYEGEHGAGAELGHTVIEVGGVLCTCGRRGCWESYSSATGLIRMTREAMESDPDSLLQEMTGRDPARVSGRTAFEAARKGDASAQKVVDRYIRYLSEGIVNMINIFRPEIFLIGGGICNEGDYLFDPIRRFAAENCYAQDKVEIPPIMRAKLGNDAGIIGAAMLAARG